MTLAEHWVETTFEVLVLVALFIMLYAYLYVLFERHCRRCPWRKANDRATDYLMGLDVATGHTELYQVAPPSEDPEGGAPMPRLYLCECPIKLPGSYIDLPDGAIIVGSDARFEDEYNRTYIHFLAPEKYIDDEEGA